MQMKLARVLPIRHWILMLR